MRMRSTHLTMTLLGIGKLRWNIAGLGSFMIVLMFVIGLVLNFGLLLLFALGVQAFWAWFVPVVAPMMPASLPYWHAFALTCLGFLYLPRSPEKKD